MKTLSSILFFISVISTAAIGQSSSTKPPFLIKAVTAPVHQTGAINYLLSLSEQDLKDKKYVLYTDSNATVAYININGNIVRMTGGTNAEGIMAYTNKGYTVTLSNTAKPGINNKDANGNLESVTSMVVYNKMGQAIAEKVTSEQKSSGK